MIFSISWKNIWRSKTRSLVVILAISFGLWGGVFGVGLMSGMINQRISAAINNEVSHIQIHHKKFMENDEPKYTIDNVNNIIAEINKITGIVSSSKRFKIQGMANKSGRQSGVYIIGVKPENEKKVTQIYSKLKDTTGTYLDNENPKDVFMGEKLARSLSIITYSLDSSSLENLKTLKINEETLQLIDTMSFQVFRTEAKMKNAMIDCIGEEDFEKYESKIRNTLAVYKSRKKVVFKMQGHDSHNIGVARRVCGVYKTSNTTFDQMNVFMDYDKLAEETGFSKDQAHEIAILAENTEVVDEIADKLRKMYPDLDIQTWKQLQPDLAMMTEYLVLYYYILIGFILFALAFGIINTMLMAVLERTKELGMLMAVGMNKMKIFNMIMLETILLSLTGGVLGMILGWAFIEIFSKVGIDIGSSGEGMEAMGYDAIIYPDITFDFYIGVTLLVVFTGIISAIYPARKALKLKPVEALRTV